MPMVNGLSYEYSKDGVLYESIFKKAEFVPENLNITASLSIPILNNKIFLVRQKDNRWDIPGGHVEKGENWEEALNRELTEEAGIKVSHSSIIGYFEVTAKTNDSDYKLKYDSPSAIAVSISFVQSYVDNWRMPSDILERAVVSFKDLDRYLNRRDDNSQLKSVVLYAKSILDLFKFTYKFSFTKDSISSDVLVTQVYGFCKDVISGDYLLVRDTGESHYSLPGGGCELGESAVEAFRRELMEEAQCEASNLILLGCTKVDIYDETKKVHLQSISQVRFYC
jgi:ADP-ribose pyrophosphatase YjhB (NUDIX family)